MPFGLTEWVDMMDEYELKDLKKYTPDKPSPPGQTLLVIMEERHISMQQMAFKMNHSTDWVRLFISGEIPVIYGLAMKIGSVLGVPTHRFWLAIEDDYRRSLAK